MSVMRSLLLAGSDSAWLRRQAPRFWFVRKSVSRFMPGEKVDDALRDKASGPSSPAWAKTSNNRVRPLR